MSDTNEEYPPGLLYNNTTRLLRNTMLYGEYKGDPGFVAEPIMTKADWERMQSLMKRNARAEQTEFYIFSGLMRCNRCGCVMAATNTRKPSKKKGTDVVYKYYRCHLAKIQKRCDNRYSMREHITERQLFEFIRAAVADRIVMVERITHERKKKKPKKGNREAIDKKLLKLKRLYVSDEMEWDEYQKEKELILSKLIEDEPEEKLPELPNLEKIRDLFEGDIEELYQTFTLEERREFWRGILTEIRIDDGHVVGVDFIE
jgi:hypothetical protein